MDSHLEEPPDNPPLWSLEVHDNPNYSILKKIDDFFEMHFPDVFKASKASEVLLWKISERNPFGRGHLTVATSDSGEVVGIASAAPRQITVSGRTFRAIEVGDTFTAPFFRNNGRTRDSEVEIHSSNFMINNEYLTKSIFGRLMYETLTRAQESHNELAYGFPNELSLRPYIKRFNFKKSNEGELYSLYLLGRNNSGKLFILFQIQRVFISVIRLLNPRRSTELIELDGITWARERVRFEMKGTADSSLIDKTLEYFNYRYLKHPQNKYFYFKYFETLKGKKHLFVVRQIDEMSLQIVEAPTEISALSLLFASIQIRNTFNENCKLLVWRRAVGLGILRYLAVGFLGINNLHFIYRWLSKTEMNLTLKSVNLGDSDNG